MLMNLREIDYILAVAEYRNFSRAAESLYISQPALSRYIANLEKQLNLNLFLRQGNKVELTAAGKQYVFRARQIALQRDLLISDMRAQTDAQAKSLVIGAMPYSGKTLLPEALTKLRRKYPELNVKLVERHCLDLESLLLKRELDLGIVGVPTNNRELNYEHLADEYVLLAVNRDNPIVRMGERVQGLPFPWIDIKKLEKEPFVVTEKGMRSRAVLERLFKQENIAPPIVCTTGNSTTALEFSIKGIGISLAFDYSFGPYLNQEREKLSIFCVGTPIMRAGVGIAYRKQEPLSPQARQFIRIYKELHTHYCEDLTDSFARP